MAQVVFVAVALAPLSARGAVRICDDSYGEGLATVDRGVRGGGRVDDEDDANMELGEVGKGVAIDG